jgi:palmitoyl-protein thioesterase
MNTFRASLLVAAVSAVPTAIFHGMGDACHHRGMKNFTSEIGEGTGDYSACVEVGNGSLTSLFENFETQAEAACASMQADVNFQVPEINVMGLSQGALLARYIATSCDLGTTKVRNLASIGGPNMGVLDIPQCFSGFICNIVNSVAREFVYLGIIQDHVGPAGYFRDTA